MWNWVSLRRDILLSHCAHVTVGPQAAPFSASRRPGWRELMPSLLPLGKATDSYLFAVFKAVSKWARFEPEVSSRLLSLYSGLVAKMFLFSWKIWSSSSGPMRLLLIGTHYLRRVLRSYLSDSVTKRRTLGTKSTSRTHPSATPHLWHFRIRGDPNAFSHHQLIPPSLFLLEV